MEKSRPLGVVNPGQLIVDFAALLVGQRTNSPAERLHASAANLLDNFRLAEAAGFFARGSRRDDAFVADLAEQ